MFTDVWMATTIGPLAEELIFRGYLFWAIGPLLARLKVSAGAATAFVVAVLFALAHASKSGITGPQLVAIIGTGLLSRGLWQIDAVVPAASPVGKVPVYVAAGGMASNAVTIQVE